MDDNDDKPGKTGKPRKSNITDNDSAKMKTSKGVIQGYDVFLNRDLSLAVLDTSGVVSLMTFFATGGDYVGIGLLGAAMAIWTGVVDADGTYAYGNAIVNVDFGSPDGVNAGYRERDYAFVYNPGWFTRLGPGVVSSADFAEDDFVVAGFWPNWATSGAAGSPVVIHTSFGDTDVTLTGLDLTFLGHTKNSFRLLANAIYNGLD